MKDVDMSFRREFGGLDDAVLIGPAQVAAVIGSVSVGAVYTALHRGGLPVPVIHANRQIRWSVGQIRAHTKELERLCAERESARLAMTGAQPAQSTALSGARRGRPRNTLATASAELLAHQ